MNKREEERLRKKEEKLRKELERLEVMSAYEKEYAQYTHICGIDEVGRGPLAGPVVACAVVLPKTLRYYISMILRNYLRKKENYSMMKLWKSCCGRDRRGWSGKVDEINILQATYEAMQMAIEDLTGKLGKKPDLLLNDAVTIPEVDIPQVPIIKGDAKSISIAAASIVAKVTRDHLMIEYDQVLPGYDFAKNKGYGTKAHIAGLKDLERHRIHRKTFITHFV